MRPRLLPAVLSALVLLGLGSPPLARADGKIPGEAAELTAEVRATAEKHVAVIVGLKPDAEKARRALLVLGPVVWPVVENALRLNPPEEAKPHLQYLKALLAKKAEPEFEYLRDRLRLKLLGGALGDVYKELVAFRTGRPDPTNPAKKIPPTCKPTTVGTAAVYRSGDGSIALAFGPDGTPEKPDAAPVTLNDPKAGFVAAVGGRAKPKERQSGAGSEAVAVAPLGFAYAYGTDGAEGVKPGGAGGDAGAAEARGGAGQYAHGGAGGAGAPG